MHAHINAWRTVRADGTSSRKIVALHNEQMLSYLKSQESLEFWSRLRQVLFESEPEKNKR